MLGLWILCYLLLLTTLTEFVLNKGTNSILAIEMKHLTYYFCYLTL